MEEVKITVVKSVGFPNYGYSLKHNQHVGFKGYINHDKTFAWYRYKRDAVKAAQVLQVCYNRAE